jgi:hypothetical protein
MGVLFVSALLIAAATTAPTPAPPFKTITTLKASPVCKAYRHMVLPLALVQFNNNQLMLRIASESQHYRKAGEAYFARNGQLLHAANIDRDATTILENLALMDRVLAQSWQQTPAGANPKVDALRRRVQNIVDLQRALANREVQSAGHLQDIDGMDVIASSGSEFTSAISLPNTPPTAVESAANEGAPPVPSLDASPMRALAASAPAVPDDDPRISGELPEGYAAKDLPRYSFRSVQAALHNESVQLSATAQVLASDCRGR